MIRLLLIISILVTPFFCFSQKKDALIPTSVSIFRDGNAFFIKEGDVPIKDGKFYLQNDQIPKARYGTLWFSSKTSTIEGIRSYTDTLLLKEKKPIQNIYQLLSANIGKNVKIETNNIVVEGTIKDFKFDGGEPSLIHILTLENKWISIIPNSISKVDFTEKPTLIYNDSITPIHHKIEIDFRKNDQHIPLKMMYLQRGVKWSPFYYLEILDHKKAKVSLRAEVINDAEDIINSDINFVVGKPGFKYSGTLTGLVKFERQINPNHESNSRSYRSDYALSEVVISADHDAKENEMQLTAENVDDYYFYSLQNISLLKGSRAQYEIFSTQVQYEDIYECDLIHKIDYNNLYRSRSEDETNTVFHSLKIKNKSKNPFTEASVFILNNEKNVSKPLSQDIIKFTPKGGSSLVKVSEAKDIIIRNKEVILRKEEDYTSILGRRYYRTTVKGTVNIKNYKEDDIKLQIRNKIQGSLLSSNAQWEILYQRDSPSSPNEINFVQWDIELDEKGEKTIEYEFEVFLD